MTSAITNAVNTPPQQQAPTPASNTSAPDGDATGTATKQTPAQIAKAQVAVAVKVNPDGTIGPHHRNRIPHIGQPGYKVNVKA